MNSQIKQLAEAAGMEIKTRRPYDDDFLGGYLESDRDFIANNQDAVLAMLGKDGLGKFARLVVQECCDLLAKEGDGWEEFANNPPKGYEHQVGKALFTAFRLKEDAVHTLKEHFGFGYAHGHRWDYCAHCGHDVVICGKCGNNTCNGGHGTVDGGECDVCESAYELYLKSMTNIDSANNQQLREFWIVESPAGLQAFDHPYDAKAYCYSKNLPKEEIIKVIDVKK